MDMESEHDVVTAGQMAKLVVQLNLIDEMTAQEALMDLGDKGLPSADYVKLLERRSLLTPLQIGKLRKGDRDGYFLGGYRLLYRIASGSFGRVYRGDDPRSGQIVAVKVLRRRWSEDPRRVEMFEREGRIGRTIVHPNIVGILAVSQDAPTGSYFIVMEFVEGGNLRDILNIRKKIDIAESLRIIEECVNGQAYAWSRGLTHRDIKPSNVLLSTDKTAKLVDFGLADLSQGGAVFSDEGPGKKDNDMQMDRTVDYAGLEKATNVTAGDVRSDIYFLGHLLYEMITGVSLIPRTKDRYAAMQRMRFEKADIEFDQQMANTDLPQPLVRLLQRCTCMEPMKRFQTPAQFLEAIKRVRAELAGDNAEEIENRRADGPLTMYIVEENQKLQDAFRDKFKALGFRVLISKDATQALVRYQTTPYHVILVDAGTAGRDGVNAYGHVLKEAATMGLEMAGILILNDDQDQWVEDFAHLSNAETFVRPVTMKQLITTLRELVPELNEAASS